VAAVNRYSEELVRNYVAAGYWTPEYPVDFWRRNARVRPDEGAVAAPDGCYTWKEAQQRIDQLATGLAADGWQRNDTLVLQAPNSAELLFLRLACEAAGVVAAMVPFTFSRAEISSIVQLLNPRGVALPPGERGQHLVAYYEDLPFRYTVGKPGLDGTRSTTAWMSTSTGALRGFPPYEYASITTTSGTTSTPRCVEHTACARLAAGRQYIERLRLTEDDVICGFTSIFAGNCDLLLYHAAPQAGSKLVLLDVFTPQAACQLIERERVTGAVFVPTLLHRLLSYPKLKDHDFSSLRFVTSFGAMLAPEIAAQAESRLGARVIQGYGASEYGALASTAIDDPAEVRLRAIGKALAGTEIDFRDESGAVLPRGAVGRIYARGPYCVGGFVNDDSATQAAWASGFVAMGDLGRLDEAGYLWLEGRARDVIIRGGQNISPLEIEDILLNHPGVREVAAVRMRDAEMGERVCVFVVPADGGLRPNLEALCAFMLERGMATFKLPERLELIDALPMNPAGTKVNKRALEALLEGKSMHARNFVTEGGDQ
jgi:non-ribosomal peptide synthetase component E (peptide arylation enzyme)